jgi:integrase
MAVAAYTGLRRGEIVGLMWKDYDGKNIWVRRNICFGERGEMSVEGPKTEARRLRFRSSLVARHPRRMEGEGRSHRGLLAFSSWVHSQEDHPATLLDDGKMTPVSPANVLRDVVAPAPEKKGVVWYGYHAFRRGLATNLRALGVDDLTIVEIPRHSDVSVTRGSHIKRVSEKSVEGMSG